MLNGLLQDIGNELAKKPFEKISWWWGPRWNAFISIQPSLTESTPLWDRDENSLQSVRLFGLRPDELQAEIVHYWQQPFWKRWFLRLFTSINSKIKLWSYYQRCLSFREVCIENLYVTTEPIALVFEQYLGREIMHGLHRNRIKFENYLEKRAGSLKWIQNNEFFISKFLWKNGQLFSKLIKKKLSKLPAEVDKDSLQSQLKKESDRLEMILFSYLYDWLKNIFKPPTANDETINNDTFVDVFAGKEISYSIHAMEDWIKMKRQVIATMLEEKPPEQFLRIKNLLESCLTRLRSLIDIHLKNSEKLIVEARWRRLDAYKAIQQTEILQTELIRFFRKSVLLFHPDKSFGNEQLRKILTELFPQFQRLSEESLGLIKEDLKTLQDYLPKQRRRQKVQKMEQEVNGNMPELEQGIETNFTQTRIELEEMQVNVNICIQTQVRSKLLHTLPNDLIQEENEPQKRRLRRPCVFRYSPVF
jgi:hypothetical protein